MNVNAISIKQSLHKTGFNIGINLFFGHSEIQNGMTDEVTELVLETFSTALQHALDFQGK
ncbi:hypothetical protein LCGC14_0610300 [marine sediment metagenome]|uniref:Uncharacterized protein n=1 Tax=marine sediment metagenome TaxID=412755 RepID=A0A0F9TU30_9ZZZZ